MQIFKDTHYDFLRWRWHALAVSWLIIISGLVVVLARGLPLGIDFSGGTIVVAKFEQRQSVQAVRQALEAALPGEKVVQPYGDPSANEVLIRLPQIAQEEGTNLEADAVRIQTALSASDLGAFEVISTEIVGPVIGEDLQRKGIYATLASLVGIMIYIALRFNLSFGAGAAVAALHDVLITLSFLVFFGYDLSLNVVAALLTITGYSVNDTIVIFDRARENMRQMRRDDLNTIINRSVNQTLGRTVITSGTTLLSVTALFVFGGEVLRGFAFTMIVGVVTGTYSTVFIAAAIAILLTAWRRSRVGASAPAAGAKKAPRRASAS